MADNTEAPASEDAAFADLVCECKPGEPWCYPCEASIARTGSCLPMPPSA